MKKRAILSFVATATCVWWLSSRHAADRPAPDRTRAAGAATLDLFGEAKDRLADARAGFTGHDLDRARGALVAATALTPAMGREAPTLGAVTSGRIVEQVLDLLDAHPELDAAARREILAYAEVTPSNLPGAPPHVRELLDHTRDVATRLAAAKRAAAMD